MVGCRLPVTRRLVRCVAFAVGIAALPGSAAAQRFTAVVVGVTDGDTIIVLRDGAETRVRLEGVDAPERGQDFSGRAKQLTSDLVFGREVVVNVRGVDRYGRTVGRVYAGDNDVSVALVDAGLAWHYKQFSDDLVLAAAESEAQVARRGLWVLHDPVPPWLFRQDGVGPWTPAARPAERLADGPYHGNSRSKVFHGPWCQHYECKNCTEDFETREEALKAGYRPGRTCNP